MNNSILEKKNSKIGPQSSETIRRIEEVMEKSAETLVLKTGERIHGIIFLEGNKYLVFSTEGGFEFNIEEVQGIVI